MPWLDAAFSSAHAAWPGLRLDVGGALEARIAGLTDTERDALHLDDLILALACAAGEPAALERFEQAILSRITSTLMRLLPTGWQLADAQQALRTKLFVTPSGTSGIERYSGRGALVSWVRTVATRLLIDARRREDEGARLSESLEARLEASGLNAELTALHAQVTPLVRAALSTALSSLDARNRTLLKLHYLDGLGFEDIARLHRVHRSTVLRWIEAIRDQLLDSVRASLATQLALQPRQLDSLLQVTKSHFDISLSPLLRGDSKP